MIDLDLFEDVLKSDEGYIEEGDTVTEEFIKRMEKYPVAKVMRLFKKSPLIFGKNSKFRFEVNLKYTCAKCGNNIEEVVTKTFISKILKGSEELICKECEEKAKIALERERDLANEKSKVLEREMILENTNNYIDIYLNPERIWNKGVKNWGKMNEIKKINWCDKDVIANYIKGMPYNEFLQTLYWKTISEKVRISSGFKCKLCNSNKHLSVHHRTYDNHGYELDHMEDLICICQECHSKFHNIKED